MSEEERSLTDDLMDAWAASEGEDDVQPAETEEVSFDGADVPEQRSEEESPESVDSGGVPIGEQEPEGAEVSGIGQDGGPPVGLSPAAREAWNETPQAVKDHIANYEQRLEGMAQKYGQDHQRVQAMDRALAPYQQFFAVNGGQPSQTVSQVLQTASILQMGTPHQKAALMANMVKQFGVDIGALDSALVGEQPNPEVSQQDMIQQAVNQAVAPFQQHMQQQNMQQQNAVNSEVAEFARNNEFFNDVRYKMADLMDNAAAQGRSMTTQEAYDEACWGNPEIRQILRDRETQAAMGQKQSAASSISGSPGGPSTPSAPSSLRGAIEAAWGDSGRM